MGPQVNVEDDEITVAGKDDLALTVRRASTGGYRLDIRRGGRVRTEEWACAIRLSSRLAMLGAHIPASLFGFLRLES